MNIELRKPNRGPYYTRGDRDIFVDGELWGYVDAHSHGQYGVTYSIRDSQGAALKGTAVESDRWHRRSLSLRSTDPLPVGHSLQERIMATVKDAVESGKLLPPAVLREHMEERVKRAALNEARYEKEKRDALRARAEQAVTDSCVPWERRVDAIVEAMLWAQSQ